MATENMNQLNLKTPDGKSFAFSVVDREARILAQQALDAAGSGGTGGDCNIQRIESLDGENLKNLRDLDSGTYILYGYFTPYSGAPESYTIDNCFTAVVHLNAGSHVMVYNPRNFKIECYEILGNADDGYTYTRDVVSLLDLSQMISVDANYNEETGELFIDGVDMSYDEATGELTI